MSPCLAPLKQTLGWTSSSIGIEEEEQDQASGKYHDHQKHGLEPFHGGGAIRDLLREPTSYSLEPFWPTGDCVRDGEEIS